MATIVLRTTKGFPLTSVELDANMSGLNDELIVSGSPNLTSREIELVTRDGGEINIDFQPIVDIAVGDATALAIALG